MKPVEVTRIVEQVVEVTRRPDRSPDASRKTSWSARPRSRKPCTGMASSMLAARHVQHAIFTNYITTLSYAYQADGLEKLPSLADGDAVLNVVEVAEGDIVRTPLTKSRHWPSVTSSSTPMGEDSDLRRHAGR